MQRHDHAGRLQPGSPTLGMISKKISQTGKPSRCAEEGILGEILAALENKLRSEGAKSVVANKGYKRYLKADDAVAFVLRRCQAPK